MLSLNQWVWSGARESAFPACSLAVPLLLVCRPRFTAAGIVLLEEKGTRQPRALTLSGLDSEPEASWFLENSLVKTHRWTFSIPGLRVLTQAQGAGAVLSFGIRQPRPCDAFRWVHGSLSLLCGFRSL